MEKPAPHLHRTDSTGASAGKTNLPESERYNDGDDSDADTGSAADTGATAAAGASSAASPAVGSKGIAGAVQTGASQPGAKPGSPSA